MPVGLKDLIGQSSPFGGFRLLLLCGPVLYGQGVRVEKRTRRGEPPTCMTLTLLIEIPVVPRSPSPNNNLDSGLNPTLS